MSEPPSPPPAYSVGSEPSSDTSQSVPSFDEVTRWLREHHHATATPTYANAGVWRCTCGAGNGPGTRLTIAQANANRDRHLRAQRKRYLEGRRA